MKRFWQWVHWVNFVVAQRWSSEVGEELKRASGRTLCEWCVRMRGRPSGPGPPQGVGQCQHSQLLAEHQRVPAAGWRREDTLFFYSAEKLVHKTNTHTKKTTLVSSHSSGQHLCIRNLSRSSWPVRKNSNCINTSRDCMTCTFFLTTEWKKDNFMDGFLCLGHLSLNGTGLSALPGGVSPVQDRKWRTLCEWELVWGSRWPTADVTSFQ